MKKLFISCTVTAVAFILASCDKDSTRTNTPENPPSDTLLIESIIINPSSLELEAGDSATLTPLILPEQSETVALEWASSDNTVATVSASGTVTALSKGTATVTASAGGVHGSSTITVIAGKTQRTIRPFRATIRNAPMDWQSRYPETNTSRGSPRTPNTAGM